MSATKTGNNDRAAKVLGHMRQFAADGRTSGTVLRDLGLSYSGDGVVFGEHVDGLHGLLIEARLAPGFGEHHADKVIANFVDNTYGVGTWKPRKPHAWERFAGDEKLDQLFQDQDAAIEEKDRLTAAFWAARDEVAAANQRPDTPPAVAVELAKRLRAAHDAMNAAYERASTARARVTSRALYLQDRFRHAQA